jgi:hypothetical protein
MHGLPYFFIEFQPVLLPWKYSLDEKTEHRMASGQSILRGYWGHQQAGALEEAE